MIDYRRFVGGLAVKLEARVKNADVSARKVDKPLGRSYYGIAVSPKGSNIGFCIDLAPEYEMFLKGRSYEEILEQLTATISGKLKQIFDFSADDIADYSVVKQRLMMQVLPTAHNRNKRFLGSLPHTKFEDLAVVYRFKLGESDEGISSILVTNDQLESYGVTEEQLKADALENAPKNFPASLCSMRDTLTGFGVATENLLQPEPPLYVATCEHGANGACCIFYPGFLDKAASQLGGNFFVLPSSIHEVLLLPVGDDKSLEMIKNLKAIVKEINVKEVSCEDFLSDSVYYYNAWEKVLSRV